MFSASRRNVASGLRVTSSLRHQRIFNSQANLAPRLGFTSSLANSNQFNSVASVEKLADLREICEESLRDDKRLRYDNGCAHEEDLDNPQYDQEDSKTEDNIKIMMQNPGYQQLSDSRQSEIGQNVSSLCQPKQSVYNMIKNESFSRYRLTPIVESDRWMCIHDNCYTQNLLNVKSCRRCKKSLPSIGQEIEEVLSQLGFVQQHQYEDVMEVLNSLDGKFQVHLPGVQTNPQNIINSVSVQMLPQDFDEDNSYRCTPFKDLDSQLQKQILDQMENYTFDPNQSHRDQTIYHAASMYLFGDPKYHWSLRLQTVQQFVHHKKYFSDALSIKDDDAFKGWILSNLSCKHPVHTEMSALSLSLVTGMFIRIVGGNGQVLHCTSQHRYFQGWKPDDNIQTMTLQDKMTWFAPVTEEDHLKSSEPGDVQGFKPLHSGMSCRFARQWYSDSSLEGPVVSWDVEQFCEFLTQRHVQVVVRPDCRCIPNKYGPICHHEFEGPAINPAKPSVWLSNPLWLDFLDYIGCNHQSSPDDISKAKFAKAREPEEMRKQDENYNIKYDFAHVEVICRSSPGKEKCPLCSQTAAHLHCPYNNCTQKCELRTENGNEVYGRYEQHVFSRHEKTAKNSIVRKMTTLMKSRVNTKVKLDWIKFTLNRPKRIQNSVSFVPVGMQKDSSTMKALINNHKPKMEYLSELGITPLGADIPEFCCHTKWTHQANPEKGDYICYYVNPTRNLIGYGQFLQKEGDRFRITRFQTQPTYLTYDAGNKKTTSKLKESQLYFNEKDLVPSSGTSLIDNSQIVSFSPRLDDLYVDFGARTHYDDLFRRDDVDEGVMARALNNEEKLDFLYQTGLIHTMLPTIRLRILDEHGEARSPVSCGCTDEGQCKFSDSTSWTARKTLAITRNGVAEVLAETFSCETHRRKHTVNVNTTNLAKGHRFSHDFRKEGNVMISPECLMELYRFWGEQSNWNYSTSCEILTDKVISTVVNKTIDFIEKHQICIDDEMDVLLTATLFMIYRMLPRTKTITRLILDHAQPCMIIPYVKEVMPKLRALSHVIRIDGSHRTCKQMLVSVNMSRDGKRTIERHKIECCWLLVCDDRGLAQHEATVMPGENFNGFYRILVKILQDKKALWEKTGSKPEEWWKKFPQIISADKPCDLVEPYRRACNFVYDTIKEGENDGRFCTVFCRDIFHELQQHNGRISSNHNEDKSVYCAEMAQNMACVKGSVLPVPDVQYDKDFVSRLLNKYNLKRPDVEKYVCNLMRGDLESELSTKTQGDILMVLRQIVQDKKILAQWHLGELLRPYTDEEKNSHQLSLDIMGKRSEVKDCANKLLLLRTQFCDLGEQYPHRGSQFQVLKENLQDQLNVAQKKLLDLKSDLAEDVKKLEDYICVKMNEKLGKQKEVSYGKKRCKRVWRRPHMELLEKRLQACLAEHCKVTYFTEGEKKIEFNTTMMPVKLYTQLLFKIGLRSDEVERARLETWCFTYQDSRQFKFNLMNTFRWYEKGWMIPKDIEKGITSYIPLRMEYAKLIAKEKFGYMWSNRYDSNYGNAGSSLQESWHSKMKKVPTLVRQHSILPATKIVNDILCRGNFAILNRSRRGSLFGAFDDRKTLHIGLQHCFSFNRLLKCTQDKMNAFENVFKKGMCSV